MAEAPVSEVSQGLDFLSKLEPLEETVSPSPLGLAILGAYFTLQRLGESLAAGMGRRQFAVEAQNAAEHNMWYRGDPSKQRLLPGRAHNGHGPALNSQ